MIVLGGLQKSKVLGSFIGLWISMPCKGFFSHIRIYEQLESQRDESAKSHRIFYSQRWFLEVVRVKRVNLGRLSKLVEREAENRNHCCITVGFELRRF